MQKLYEINYKMNVRATVCSSPFFRALHPSLSCPPFLAFSRDWLPVRQQTGAVRIKNDYIGEKLSVERSWKIWNELIEWREIWKMAYTMAMVELWAKEKLESSKDDKKMKLLYAKLANWPMIH